MEPSLPEVSGVCVCVCRYLESVVWRLGWGGGVGSGFKLLELRKLVLKSALDLYEPHRHENQSRSLVPRQVLGSVGSSGSFTESFDLPLLTLYFLTLYFLMEASRSTSISYLLLPSQNQESDVLRRSLSLAFNFKSLTLHPPPPPL